MAAQFFPGEDPVGKRLMIEYNDFEAEIVGVVGNALQTDLRDTPQPHMYVSYLQTYEKMFTNSLVVVVKTESNPSAAGPIIRRQVAALDPLLAPYEVLTMDERLANSLGRERFMLYLLGGFAAIAVALAAVGLYGVVSW
jgi:putative ABC transport system permease protein